MDNKKLGLLAVIMIAVGIIGLVFIYGINPELGGFGGMGNCGIFGWNDNNSYGGMMGSSMMGNMDRHFIEQMIPHHNDAILMAEIALKQAEHEEIKRLAENISRTQSEENALMRRLYKSWYDKDVPVDSSSMGMGGMMDDGTDVKTLGNAKPFDKEFIEQMIPHHQMAIMMATMLLQGTDREEMKTLAQAIIDAQSREIGQMRLWYRSWYGE